MNTRRVHVQHEVRCKDAPQACSFPVMLADAVRPATRVASRECDERCGPHPPAASLSTLSIVVASLAASHEW